MKISLPIKQIKACNVFSSDEETRYYLNGVHITRIESGYLLEATQGHVAARFKIIQDDGVTEAIDFILRSEDIEKIKVVKGCDYLDIEYVTGSDVKLKYAGVTYQTAAIDGTFPDMDRVWITLDGTEKGYAQVGFNADMLALYSKANKILKEIGTMVFNFSDDNLRPAVISVKVGLVPLYETVLMPVRV